MTSALRLTVLLALASALVAADAPAARAEGAAAGSSERLSVRLSTLTAVRRVCAPLAVSGSSLAAGELPGGWAECALIGRAVLGASEGEPFTFDDIKGGAASGETRLVLAAPDGAARDTVAYQLLSIGYSARESADVVSGRITKQALDHAQRMIAAGQGREAAADYLDREYNRLAIMQAPRPVDARDQFAGGFDALIDHYARLHQVQPSVVRAVVDEESAFRPAVRSPAGAIGLMQLMPATARELGVNPLVPEQNLEGGLRYRSQLIREFGTLELALIAYNAGPGYAQRYARDGTALYGETRAYVRRILPRLGWRFSFLTRRNVGN